MTAVTMANAPVEMQVALLVFAVVGLVLALHENGWLTYLRDRRVVGALLALVLALGWSQTTQAAVYDLTQYCESWFGWIDFWFC